MGIAKDTSAGPGVSIRRRRTVLKGPITAGIAIVVAGTLSCAKISVVSPDGRSTATYDGTSIVGSEDVSCGQMAGVTTCSVSGQNLSALAMAIAPFLQGTGGTPIPVPTPAPTPAITEVPAR